MALQQQSNSTYTRQLLAPTITPPYSTTSPPDHRSRRCMSDATLGFVATWPLVQPAETCSTHHAKPAQYSLASTTPLHHASVQNQASCADSCHALSAINMLATKTSAIAMSCTCGGRTMAASSPFFPPPLRKAIYQYNNPSQRHTRTFATPAKDDVPLWPTKPHPTPYEIFDIQKSAPYTKRRFYQLVKLYHPDTHDPNTLASQELAPAVLLERYRLVVAANKLLSDPAKRRLYDTQGIGWSLRGPDAAPTVRERDHAWRHQPNSPVGNATWEDWQRWQKAHDPNQPKAEPVYASNGTFAFLVIAVCFVGAMAHVNRAEIIGAQYVEYSAQQNADIGNQVRRATLASAGKSKDERVNNFMRERENTAYQFAPAKYDASEKDS